MEKDDGRLIPIDIAGLLVDIFYEKTGFPTIIFETKMMDNAAKGHCLKNFSPFCKLVFELGLKEKCEGCHRDRAFNDHHSGITTCWLGLHNIKSKIDYNNETVAVLLYGQRLITDQELLKKSACVFNNSVKKLNINADKTGRLRRLYNDIPKVTLKSITDQASSINKISRWIYLMVNEKTTYEKATRDAYHELATNLQAALADAEYYSLKIAPDSSSRESALQIMYSIERLNVVVQNLGGFLGDYSDGKVSLSDLITRTSDMYRALANRKCVEISIYQKDSHTFPTIFGSQRHLEFAFSNLVHNAVKYSYRGFYRSQSKPVEVEIFGHYDGTNYLLHIKNFGVGILEDEIKTGVIFKRGYRGILAKPEYRTGGGAGLGVVKDVFDSHEFGITISSVCVYKKMPQNAVPDDYKKAPFFTTVTILIPKKRIV